MEFLAAPARKIKPCDLCRMRKRKCDGKSPCSTCANSKKFSPCKYSKQKLGTLELLKKLEDMEEVISALQSTRVVPVQPAPQSQFFLDTNFNSVLNSSQYYDISSTSTIPEALPVINNHSPINFLLTGPSESSFSLFDSPKSSDLVSPVNSIAAFSADEEVEDHLISISMQDSNGYSAENGRTVRTSCRVTAFKGNLRRALCYRSVFLSTHPKLFPSGDFSFANRKSIAEKLYSLQPTPTSFANNLEICDEINAVMTHCATLFSIGSTVEGTETRKKAYELIRVLGILHPSTFGVNINSSFLSLDDMSSAVLPAKSFRFILTDDERADYLFTLGKMLTLDMFHSLGSGYPYFINDEEFPDMPAMKGNFMNTMSNFRHTNTPKYTIYQNTVYEKLFDSIVVDRANGLPCNSLQHAIQVIQFMKFFRKIVTFSRSLKYCSEDNMEKLNRQAAMHCAVLDISSHLGENSIADLTPFFWSNRASGIPLSYYHSPTSPVDLPMSALLQLCFLHFPTSEYKTRKFPMTSNGPAIYTSIEILYAVIHALHFLINRADAPGLQHGSNLPSPGYLHPTFPLRASILCTSAASAFLKSGTNKAMTLSLVEMIKSINTTIRQVASIWPVGWAFAKNVDNVLAQYPADLSS